jgi:methylmalonyl-CoA mutase N-terminal domain/subunit
VVAYESGVADFVDALAGSYAVESLTTRLETLATEQIARIDDLGGMVAAIERGYPQREIQRTAYEYQLEIEHRQRIVVGVNSFERKIDSGGCGDDAAAIPVTRIDPRIESEQVERLRSTRARRDRAAHATALERVEQAARGVDNVLPPMLDAVKAYATVGEIAHVLRRVWGEHTETLVI